MVFSEFIVTVQVPVPEQPPPDQPTKVKSLPAVVAVSITDVPDANEALQVEPQLMPSGELVTMLKIFKMLQPVTDLLIVKVYEEPKLKVAVTLWAEFMVTVQVPVPEQPPPDQPVKVEPELAVAVSVTDVPLEKEALQVEPQLMPEGVLVTTVPVPVPDLLTVKDEPPVKVAVTLWAEFIATVQAPVPEQPPPDQPVKVEPELGVADSVTVVPDSNEAVQVEPQLMPEGELLTVPEPVPDLIIVKGGVELLVLSVVSLTSIPFAGVLVPL